MKMGHQLDGRRATLQNLCLTYPSTYSSFSKNSQFYKTLNWSSSSNPSIYLLRKEEHTGNKGNKEFQFPS